MGGRHALLSAAAVLQSTHCTAPRHRYYMSLLSRMRKRDAMHVLLTSLVDKPGSRRIAIQ
jgi:hypothetical protein